MPSFPIVIVAALSAVGEAPAPPDPAELVARLGSPSFRSRERAADRLVGLGEAGADALRAGAASPNPEIRHRSRALLRVIGGSEDARLRAAFLGGNDAAAAPVARGWQAFREEVGGDEAARRFFLELWRAEPRLLTLLQESEGEAGELLNATAEGFNKANTIQTGPEYPLFPVAAMAVVSLAVGDDLPRNARHQFIRVVQMAGYRNDLPADPTFRKLLGRWVLTQSDAALSSSGVRIARQYGLPEGVELSRAVLRAPGSSHGKAEAILTLGENGEAEDARLIEPLISDTTRLGGFRVNGQPWVYAHVGDVALGVSIILAGENPRAYGFEHLNEGTHRFNSTSSFGFDSDEKRAAAFRRWKERTAPRDGA